MKSIKIIISEIEFVTDEQYEEIIEKLEELPLTYEIWYKENEI